jgi:hypothetical protein
VIQRCGYLTNLHNKGSILGLANLSRNLSCLPFEVHFTLVTPFCYSLASSDCYNSRALTIKR